MSPRTAPPKAPSTYVSGHHAGPTPWRCSGSATNPNGSVVICQHDAHRTVEGPIDVAVDEPEEPMTATTSEAGVVDDLDEASYHAHPTLSSTGARQLLQLPARFAWTREHGQAPKQVFDFGHAAHRLVLGKGDEFAVLDADSWRGKAAGEFRDAARAANRTPLLVKELEQAKAMADAVHAHPIAGALFEPGTGVAERSVFWTDPATGVSCRARYDWWRDAPEHGGRALCVDLKTTGSSADPRALPKTIASYHYEQQADFYVRGARELGLAEDVVFLFVFVEKEPPHPVTVVELDVEALRVGRERNDQALRLFQLYTATDSWPSYSEDVELVSLPGWAIYQHDIEIDPQENP